MLHGKVDGDNWMCYEFCPLSEGLEVNSGNEYPSAMLLFSKYVQGAADIVN